MVNNNYCLKGRTKSMAKHVFLKLFQADNQFNTGMKGDRRYEVSQNSL